MRKCAYCDFYSLPNRLDSLEPYLQAVQVEAAGYAGLRFSSLFLGGGTPSLLGAAGLDLLMTGLKQHFHFASKAEATLEANPDSVNSDLLQAALTQGFNRLSLGVQSLSDPELQKAGRIHSAEQAVRALELAGGCGFKNISADLIIGLPGQTWQTLLLSLETLVGLGVEHLSVYCLSLEPGTPLAAAPPADLPDEDVQADLYAQATALLEKRGFLHYEISNFALPGYECRHNLNYWREGEYIGLGPSAASHFKGRRYKNHPDLAAYLNNPGRQREEVEKLSKSLKAEEEAVLRLRLLQEGLDIADLIARYGDASVVALADRLNKLSVKGHLLRDGSRFRLNPAEALVSNSILADLLGD